jgi:hypothetical protein
MTQTPKQWATTGFIIGVATGLAAIAMIFFVMRNDTANAAQTQPAPVTAKSPALLSGTLELEPSAAGKVTLPTVVFVIARAEGLLSHGHPLLAKRIDVQAFPASFTLSAEDSMMGQPPPNRVSLEARIDRDGDATTREPGSPIASIESIAIGTTNVKLVLKP